MTRDAGAWRDARASGRAGRWRSVAAAVALVGWLAALYAPSLANDFVYDDHVLILEQPRPRGLSDLLGVFGERHWSNLPYYRPVSRLTMVFQKWLHGNRPAPYHVFNVALAAATALLLRALLGLPGLRTARGPAWLAALLFAVHPITSACVHPICSGRETLLPGALVLAAMLAHLSGGAGARALALLAFALALLAKEQAVVLPGLFALADGLRLSRDPPGRDIRRWLVRYAPAAVLLLAYAGLRGVIFPTGGEIRLALLERPAGPLLSLLYTLQTSVAPFGELVYEPRGDVWLSGWRLAAALLTVAGMLALAWRSAPETRRVVVFWAGWVVLAILPTANLLVQEAPFAERYGLLALAGLLGAAAALLSPHWSRRVLRAGALAVALAMAALWSAQSWQRGRYFRDDLAFHGQWLRSDPGSAQALLGLGGAWAARGQPERAAAYYRRALAVREDYAAAHASLGMLLASQGELAGATRHLERALVLEPGDARSHSNLGVVLARRGHRERALRAYRRALDLDPDLAEAHNNLGALHRAGGEEDAALAHFERAVALDPELASAHLNLADLLAARGDEARAAEHRRRAKELGLDPQRPAPSPGAAARGRRAEAARTLTR